MKVSNVINRKHANKAPSPEMNANKVHPPMPKHHMPPHLRKNMVQIEFDDEDREIFLEIAQDEDSAEAMMQTIQDAPPEIKILTYQLMLIIKKGV